MATFPPPTCSTADSFVVQVRDHVRDLQAAHPEDGESLAKFVALHASDSAVSLDFSSVTGMNSAFSNAFLHGLAKATGLGAAALLNQIRLLNASEFQRLIFDRSRAAILRGLSPPGPT